jgi:hypothetical protein
MADSAPIDEAGGGGSRTPTPVDLWEDIAGHVGDGDASVLADLEAALGQVGDWEDLVLAGSLLSEEEEMDTTDAPLSQTWGDQVDIAEARSVDQDEEEDDAEEDRASVSSHVEATGVWWHHQPNLAGTVVEDGSSQSR